MMRLVSLLICLLLATPALADDAFLPQLMQQLARVKTATAHFTERKYMAVLDQPLDSAGTLTYQAPDRVEKITESPAPERFVVAGNHVTIEQGGETHQLELGDYPEIQAFVASIRAPLAGDLTALQRFYTVDATGSLQQWQLTLTPIPGKAKPLVDSIILTGHGSEFETIETVETDGDRSVLTISDLVTGEALP
jgi:outer membrane lipoprotein-sorting protein